MAILKESGREQKITDVQRQDDGLLLVTVETTITNTVLLEATEWSKTNATGKVKAVGKATMIGVVNKAVKAAKP